MKAPSRRTRIFGFFALIIGCCVACTAQEQSAAELIRSLTRLSDLEAMGVINNPCGQLMTERRSAMALAALGDAALPDLEKVLDATDARQGTSFGLPWLEMAYPRIKGRAAYERLRGLELDSKVGADGPFGEDSGRRELDSAVALSLGLTSFVSAPRQPLENYRECKNDANLSTLSPSPCPPVLMLNRC